MVLSTLARDRATITHVVRGMAIPIQETAFPVEEENQRGLHQQGLHQRVVQLVEMEKIVVHLSLVKLAVLVGGVPVSRQMRRLCLDR